MQHLPRVRFESSVFWERFWERFERRGRPHLPTLQAYAAILVLAIGIVAACFAWMVIAR